MTRKPFRLLLHAVAAGLATAVLLAPATSWSNEQPSRELRTQCEQRLAETVVRVVSQPSDVVYDFSKSVQELTRMSPAAHGARWTLGLARARMRVATKWSVSSLTFEQGRGCLRPSLTVTLSAGPQTVYVAREFPRGTCAFDEIAAHELRHVKANQEHLERVADRYQAEMAQFFGQRIFYGNVQALQKQLEQAVSEHWTRRILDELDQVDAHHRRIDSVEEYARNETMCDGEVPRRLRALRTP